MIQDTTNDFESLSQKVQFCLLNSFKRKKSAVVHLFEVIQKNMAIFNRALRSLILIAIIELLIVWPKINCLHCRPSSIFTGTRSPYLGTYLSTRASSRLQTTGIRRDLQLNAGSSNENFSFDPYVVWKFLKGIAPPVITGAYKDDQDVDAGGAIYNLIFVRLPTIAGGILYFQRIADGAPQIVMDLGLGKFELSPILVVAAMFLILRPAS